MTAKPLAIPKSCSGRLAALRYEAGDSRPLTKQNGFYLPKRVPPHHRIGERVEFCSFVEKALCAFAPLTQAKRGSNMDREGRIERDDVG